MVFYCCSSEERQHWRGSDVSAKNGLRKIDGIEVILECVCIELVDGVWSVEIVSCLHSCQDFSGVRH